MGWEDVLHGKWINSREVPQQLQRKTPVEGDWRTTHSDSAKTQTQPMDSLDDLHFTPVHWNRKKPTEPPPLRQGTVLWWEAQHSCHMADKKAPNLRSPQPVQLNLESLDPAACSGLGACQPQPNMFCSLVPNYNVPTTNTFNINNLKGKSLSLFPTRGNHSRRLSSLFSATYCPRKPFRWLLLLQQKKGPGHVPAKIICSHQITQSVNIKAKKTTNIQVLSWGSPRLWRF